MNGIPSRASATTLGFIHPAVAIQKSIERKLRLEILYCAPTARATAAPALKQPNHSTSVTAASPLAIHVAELFVPVATPILCGGRKRDLRLLVEDPWHKENREYWRSKKPQRYDKSRRDHQGVIGVTERQLAGADLFALLRGFRNVS